MNIKMPNGQLVTIPAGQRELKIGLIRAAIIKSELTTDQFVELL